MADFCAAMHYTDGCAFVRLYDIGNLITFPEPG